MRTTRHPAECSTPNQSFRSACRRRKNGELVAELHIELVWAASRSTNILESFLQLVVWIQEMRRVLGHC